MNQAVEFARENDEIDLRDLVMSLINGWRWVISTAVAVVALAVVYLLVATPIYSTNVVFAPSPDGLQSLNALPGINYSEEEALGELAVRLGSYENFSNFLAASEEHRERLTDALSGVENLTDLPASQYEFFSKNVTVAPLGDEEDENDLRQQLTFTFTDRVDGPDFVNQYYRWTDQQVTAMLAERAQRTIARNIRNNESRMSAILDAQEEQVEARITRMQENDAIRLKQLQDELNAEIASVFASREERIRVLRNAESIAERMGIKRPTTPRDLSPRQGNAEVVYAEINAANSQDGLPLYFMGTDALKAEREVIEANLREETKTAAIRNLEKQIAVLENNREIEALQAREDNAAFSEEYNRLKEENTLLRANDVLEDEIEVSRVISWAYQPAGPDSPKKLLILALSVVLGGMLGVFVLMVVRLVRPAT